MFGAYRLQFLYGALPTIKLPLLSNATHERHNSSLFGPVVITLGVVSLNATTELVVPRSIPIDIPMIKKVNVLVYVLVSLFYQNQCLIQRHFGWSYFLY